MPERLETVAFALNEEPLNFGRSNPGVLAAGVVVGCGSSGGHAFFFRQIGSYSGAQASSEAGAQKVINAWAQWANSHSGVSGHPIRLIVKDDGGVRHYVVLLDKFLHFPCASRWALGPVRPKLSRPSDGLRQAARRG